ncbi:MAG: glycosyltransferase family 2 protein [Thermodesulfovibrionales bacterium]|nr:glycosyltransferase family 2 protein [Thermodesulfovibrionales bacterium]
MTNNKIDVSIVIPCRNEKNFINECIESIIENDFPQDNFEVLIVDGMSEDGTRDIIRQHANKYPFIILLDNPKRITPVAMNIGIKQARGNYIVILSSHSKIDKNFLKLNLEYIVKHNVDCVGGILITLPHNSTILAKSIAKALSHPFGVGNAYFRTGSKESRNVDTVPFGCYKKDIFQKVGLFDEDLIRNQDDEFNHRLIRKKGKILLIPDIISYYYARNSLTKLWRMYYQYGYFKPLVSIKIGAILTLRQIIPSLFLISLFLSAIAMLFSAFFLSIFTVIVFSYLFLNIGISLVIALREGLRYLFYLPFVFATMHLSYGAGYLKGILNFIVLKQHIRKKISDVPMTR